MTTKKTTKKKEEEIKTVEETVIIDSDFAKLLEIYKVQNPVKYRSEERRVGKEC